MSDDLDDLDDLKAAMKAATPAPDASRKAADIALARKNFAALQESREGARLTSDHPEKRGILRGVRQMLTTFSTQFPIRGALTASTALVALGLVVVVPEWQQGPDMFSRAPAVREAEPASGQAVRERAEADAATTALQSEERMMADDAAGIMPEPAPMPMLEAAPMARAPERYAVGALKRVAPVDGEMVIMPAESSTEAYPDADQNPLKIVAEEPVSTFSIDVDTASYAVVRSSLTNGQMPPEGAVRIEEMVNYFPYDYPAPEAGEAPFKPTVTVTDTPWNPDTQLLHIAIQGEQPAIAERPPLNLVFLIDTSGSMHAPDKLELLKQSFALMLPQLTEADEVAIVTYAGSAGQVLEATPGTDREAILAALENLAAGGSTAGQEGLQQAYSVAEGMAAEGEVTRVILATDGDFNVGLSDPEALESYIAKKRESGTYLSVMGFGRGNLDDATMQALAQNGNGQASYIDTLAEAQKVLVDQFTGALFPIANDVKIQVEFNPERIVEYRLIGYETRALNREDFNNDKVDAGDIGAGHSVTAIYEITPVGSPAQMADPLRYGEAAADEGASGEVSEELGYFKLRYKAPGESESQLIELPITEGGEVSADMRFAMAIAGFGQLLTDSPFLGDWGYAEAIALANGAKGDDPYGYRAEAVRLMRLAESLDR
ncbi:MAG: VWA domain-containing protein [Roseovarius sp.]